MKTVKTQAGCRSGVSFQISLLSPLLIYCVGLELVQARDVLHAQSFAPLLHLSIAPDALVPETLAKL
jgi:hypothetical protein